MALLKFSTPKDALFDGGSECIVGNSEAAFRLPAIRPER